MAELPTVESAFGWAAQAVEQDERGARVTIVKEGGAERETLEADYVVGCDGGHSIVREQIGIERGGTDFDQLMVLAVIRSRELHEGFKRFPPRSTFRAMHPDLKGYWMFFGRVDVGEGFFFHAPVPPDTTRDNFDFHGLMQRAAGFNFACEFDYVGFWDLRIAVAETIPGRTRLHRRRRRAQSSALRRLWAQQRARRRRQSRLEARRAAERLGQRRAAGVL